MHIVTVVKPEYFEPLKKRQALPLFKKSLPDASESFLVDSYNMWVWDFHKKSIGFYKSQFAKYRESEEHEFRRRYHIPRDFSITEYGREDEWREWCNNRSINIHQHEMDSRIKAISNDCGMSGDKLPNADAMNILNAIWFDGISDAAVINPSCCIEYEEYLRTPRWRRIRAAMLLINNAKCQHDECEKISETYYFGNEADIHVHHVDYRNLGRERYVDLKLLCRQHHKKEHENSEISQHHPFIDS